MIELLKEFGPQTVVFIIAIVAMWRLIVHFTKRDEKTHDRVLSAFEKNSEAFIKLNSTIERSIDITEKSSIRIEDLWTRAIKQNGRDGR